MSPTRADQILAEWSDVAKTATAPAAPVASLGPRVRGVGIGALGAGLLAIAFVVAIAWLADRLDGPNVGGVDSPSPEPTVAAPTPATSPLPSDEGTGGSAPLTWTCPRAFTIAIDWRRVGDTSVAQVSIHNRGADPCEFGAVSSVDYGMNDGTTLIRGSATSGAPNVVVPPGQTATSMVTISNYCGEAPIHPLDLDFHRVDGGEWVVGSPPEQMPLAVPPCLDAGQPATVDMQPWVP